MQDVESPPKMDLSNVSPAQSTLAVPAAGPARAPSRTRWLAALVLAACAVLAGGGYYAWRTAQDVSAASPLTAVVTLGNLEDTVTATGTLQPKEFVDVGTRVPGQLKKLLVDIGAVVKTGQLLAEIDPSVYQAKVDGDRAPLLDQQVPIVVRIANLSTMTRQAQVSEADVPKLRVGMDVYFTTRGGTNRRYDGKLRRIPPTPTTCRRCSMRSARFFRQRISSRRSASRGCWRQSACSRRWGAGGQTPIAPLQGEPVPGEIFETRFLAPLPAG